MRHSLGFAALSVPLLVWFLDAFTGITARWHFSDHFRLYDLLADGLLLVVVGLGLTALLRRDDLFRALVGLVVLFSLFQLWAWQSAPARALDALAIPGGIVVAHGVDRPEFTVEGAVDLVQYRYHLGFFIAPVATLAQWDQVYRIALLTHEQDRVQVELEMLDHQVQAEDVALAGLVTN